MKKSLIAVFAGLVSAAAFAGMGNVVISFSTVGPDKYADGSRVRDGETYALVWTRAGSTFAGKADENNKIVLKAPEAADHKCPYIQFQVDEDWVNANCPGGTWGVYLFDTRKFKADANGVLLLEGGKPIFDGFGTTVTGWGLVAQATTTTMGSVGAAGSIDVNKAVASGSIKITKIDPSGEFVYLYAEGAVDGVPYGIKNADTPDALGGASAVQQYGKPIEGKMIFVQPKKGDKGFYTFGR